MDKYQIWLSKLKDSWIKKDIEQTIDLFSDECQYYEDPFSLLDDKESIAKVWEPVRSHKNIRLDFSTIRAGENFAVATWTYDFEYNGKQHAEGAYFIEIDDNGLCKYFIRLKTA